MIRARGVVAAALVAVLLLSGGLGAQNQDQPPTFRTSTEAVQISVIVTDDAGNPVAGLTADDFELVEDGETHPVTTFSAVNIPVERADPLQSDMDVLTNARPPGRVYIIALDDMSAENAQRTKQFLREFLEQYFGPNDSAAVVLLTAGPADSGQEFTSSPRRLLAAVDRFGGGETMGNAWSREKNFSGDFKALVKVIATLPAARKALILVSGNIPLDAELLRGTRASRIGRMFQDINMDFHEAVSLATRNNIAVYPINPGGLSTGVSGEDPSELTAAAPSSTERMEAQGRLAALAEMTGGFEFSNSNNYAAAFERLVRENSTYYVLGFNSGETRRDGQFARLNVRVKRPGLTVQTLEGYLTPSRRPEPVKRPSTVMAGAWDAVASPLTASGVNLRLFAAPYRSEKKEATIALTIEIATDRLNIVERDGAYRGQLDILFAITEAKGGKRFPIMRHRAELNLKPETYASVKQRALRVLSELRLPKGRYQIRAAAGVDVIGGSVVYDVDVPDFRADFSLSGIALTSVQARETFTVAPHERLNVGFPGPPTTAREFAQDDVLTLFAEAYENRKKKHTVRFAISLRDLSGKVLDTLQTEHASAEKPKDVTVHPFSPSLPLAEVPPGRYVVHLEARSSLSRDPIERIVPISVRAARGLEVAAAEASARRD